ncbi:MAG: hypothetical protein ACOYMZ_01910 [Minisyncoccia bacterium]
MGTAFKKLLEERRKEYHTWVPIYCPALRTYVFFNAKGFTHLRFKTDNTPRAPKEAMYKLGLLPLVRSVIHNATAIEKYEQRVAPVGGSRKKVLKEMQYWGITEVVGKQQVKIKVVLRKIGDGEHIHFWSVMKLS